MTQFEKLFDAIDLWKAGRKNAAKAQWQTLLPEFQDKVFEFVLFGLDNRQHLSSTSPVTLRSPKFGIFNLTTFSIEALLQTVPELVS